MNGALQTLQLTQTERRQLSEIDAAVETIKVCGWSGLQLYSCNATPVMQSKHLGGRLSAEATSKVLQLGNALISGNWRAAAYVAIARLQDCSV